MSVSRTMSKRGRSTGPSVVDVDEGEGEAGGDDPWPDREENHLEKMLEDELNATWARVIMVAKPLPALREYAQ